MALLLVSGFEVRSSRRITMRPRKRCGDGRFFAPPLLHRGAAYCLSHGGGQSQMRGRQYRPTAARYYFSNGAIL